MRENSFSRGRSGFSFGHVHFRCPLDIQEGILKGYTRHESWVKVGLRGKDGPGGLWGYGALPSA